MPKDSTVSDFILNGQWNLPNPTTSDMLTLWPQITAINFCNNNVDEIRCLGLAAAQVLLFSSGVFVVGYDIID
ncbi:hypothetical protein Taro_043411 [Colocasia esculenta]|uniref:Uncharacterized protein n=1 Tax=Colocasia esculenta TaxID=4460 RepID=A0A843WYV7_COLES|nr:hypothetical protein [Colocasia esculenta]